MKIILPGGSGQIGQFLARKFSERGDDVVILARRTRTLPHARVVAWDGETFGDWAREFDGADVVINLAGRTVNCRYTATNLKQMMDSRVLSTRAVGTAIVKAATPPSTWLQMSTATIYAHRFDAPNDEATGIIGGREVDAPAYWKKSIDIATAWETTLAQAATPSTRKVALRSAIVMSPQDGGAFATLLHLVRFGLGGDAGKGKQRVSWMHEDDFFAAVCFLIEHKEIDGAVNLAAPNPVTNHDFMQVLREVSKRRFGLDAMPWMLEVGAFFLRTDTELLLKSRYVVPKRLLDAGFVFRYPTWSEAAKNLATAYQANAKLSD